MGTVDRAMMIGSEGTEALAPITAELAEPIAVVGLWPGSWLALGRGCRKPGGLG